MTVREAGLPDEIVGISEDEAAGRLRTEGFNEIPDEADKGVFHVLLGIVSEPMFLLLIACGVIYFLIGDLQEAAMLLAFVLVVIAITFYQERKTSRALKALRDLSSPRALVIRDGRRRRIAGREVVRKDILILTEGDRVPADGRILSSLNLEIDESLLTGESVPVRKVSADSEISSGDAGAGGRSHAYSGTLVVSGQGLLEVTAIGTNTEMGKIGRILSTIEEEPTVLQKGVSKLVRNLAIIGTSICLVIVIVYGISRNDWLHGFLAGLTLAMAILPEEFPMVLTIFLALGAWRLSRRQILTRRIPAVEALGAATMLCVDKTGTLTTNQMSVRKIVVGNSSIDLEQSNIREIPEQFHEIIEYSILASKRDPHDPMDKAFLNLGSTFLRNTEHIHHDWQLVQEYPISGKLLAISHVWKSPDGDDFVIAAKGAPEAIVDLCHLDSAKQKEIVSQSSRLAAEGLRVLGVSRALFKKGSLPDIQHDFVFEFLGLMGLADPLRESVPAAIRECREAGVGVAMITGDYPDTARSIAVQAGLDANKIITGEQIARIDDAELIGHIRETRVFARIMPEQKLKIVNGFKAAGEIVAMTGDGVNDAPALRAAHIGIAMGSRGTDVAREASSLVILDDDFSSIVQAIRLGRRIFDNIKKAMIYIFAVHIPIAGMSLLPVLLGLPLVLFPIHIVFLELVIDPACSIAFESELEEKNIMARPPRNAKAPLFGRTEISIGLLQGLAVLLAMLGIHIIGIYGGRNPDEVRALAFTTLILANLGLILTNRSWSRSIGSTIKSSGAAHWLVIGGSLTFLSAALYIPSLKTIFKFEPLHWNDWLICLGAATVCFIWFEFIKRLHGSRNVSPNVHG